MASSLRELDESLTRSYGPLLGGAALTRALGYPSQSAFRQAVAHDRLPVPVFEIEGRRGRFALTADIAAWLWRVSEGRQRNLIPRASPSVCASDGERAERSEDVQD